MCCHSKLGVDVISKSLICQKTALMWGMRGFFISFYGSGGVFEFSHSRSGSIKDVNDGACGISDNLPTANNINHHKNS